MKYIQTVLGVADEALKTSRNTMKSLTHELDLNNPALGPKTYEALPKQISGKMIQPITNIPKLEKLSTELQ